jgi:predicted RNase H-like nuclease (RuvC/YqgF family)
LSIEKNLDYALFPDNTEEKVQHLVDSLQSVRLRLLTLETSFTTAESESPELMHSLEAFNEKWRGRIRNVLEKWARLEHTDSLVKEWSTRATLLEEMEQRLDQVNDDFDGQALRNLYAVLGSTQSLLEAMNELGDSMQQINWDQWAVARF